MTEPVIKLPPIPRFIRSAAGPVAVVRAVRIVNNKIECNGLWDSNARTITIRRGLSRQKAWWVLFHEETHMELEDGGVSLPLDLEEAVCDAMATARLARLHRRLSYTRSNGGRRARKRPSASGRSSARGKTT